MLTPFFAAPQQRPRPLPLFLDLLRHETAGAPARMAAALAGLRLYQQAPRRPRPAPRPIVAQAGRATLFDHAPGGAGRPVIVVPSLINTPDILDLDEERSLLRWLAGRGLRPLLVDWGVPDAGDAALDLAGHVETLLLPLIDAVGGGAAMIGYCLGGTMAIAAAMSRPPSRLALIATPWRFAGYPDAARAAMAELWTEARDLGTTLGLLPIELLQIAFWRLDPARTVDKFERIASLAADDPRLAAFVAVEDWANAGAPLTLGVGRDLFERLLARDETGTGRWRVGDRRVDPERLACPILDIVSRRDRIVPAASAIRIGRSLPLDLGHVGMIVGSGARAALWEPLARWLTSD